MNIDKELLEAYCKKEIKEQLDRYIKSKKFDNLVRDEIRKEIDHLLNLGEIATEVYRNDERLQRNISSSVARQVYNNLVTALKHEDDYIYELKNPNELDDNFCIYCPLYLLDNFGDIIEDITDEIAQKVVNEYDMFKNREDKILIDIAKEINNKNLIKIIEIPDDAEYEVAESDCGFSEWVEEKHRVWY